MGVIKFFLLTNLFFLFYSSLFNMITYNYRKENNNINSLICVLTFVNKFNKILRYNYLDL